MPVARSNPPPSTSFQNRGWVATRGPLILGVLSIVLSLWLAGLVHDPLEGILLLKRRIAATLLLATGLGSAVLWSRLVRAESARSMADRMLRKANEEFRRSVDQLPVMIWTTDAQRRPDFANKAWLEFVGSPVVRAQGWSHLVVEDDRDRVQETSQAAFDDRQPMRNQFRMRAADDEVHAVISHGSPRYAPTGEFIGYIGVTLDVTPLEEANESLRRTLDREHALRRELDHRVRNNLASLIGLAAIYGRAGWSGPRVAEAFREKLFAIKEVHDLVSGSTSLEADLEQLCRRLARALGADERTLTIEGPKVFLRPEQAGPMAMILQELFTNSRKHGALSKGGRIVLEWLREEHESPDETRIRFSWTEFLDNVPLDSPEVEPFPGAGLGLIRGFAASELRGGAELEFRPDLVRCVIRIVKATRPSKDTA